VGELAIAALKALRFIGDERARVRIEASLVAKGTEAEQRTAAELLGELKDPAAEHALATSLSNDSSSVRWTARAALEKLFPLERTRLELLSVRSTQDDIAQPAAAYLANEGDPGELLSRMAELRDEELRSRLRFGLARRVELPYEKLERLLLEGSVEARADAAWVIGTRDPGEKSRSPLVATLTGAARKALERRSERAAAGKQDEASAETIALTNALFAMRSFVTPETLAIAREVLTLGADISLDARLQAAYLVAQSADEADAELLAGPSAEPELRSANTSGLAQRKEARFTLKGTPDPVHIGQIAATRPLPSDGLSSTTNRRIHLPRVLRENSVEALLAVARRGEAQDRIDAILAFGRMGGGVAIEFLKTLAFDKPKSDVAIRKAAYGALRRAQRHAEALTKNPISSHEEATK
jgi:ParB family chromosome partitioning protein